jgi:ABC-2 type transport system ATP-binding protein
MQQPKPDATISIKNLRKKFCNFTAVDGMSFDIYRNEIFGLLGPNGAGKTTTINMICGLLPPTEGSIMFNGRKVSGFDKSIIGYCPQENIFYPKLTCLEQLLFVGKMYNLPSVLIKKRAAELLELLGLKEKMNVRASKLSGGMKRRLNICLALIHDPEILVLDEPEAGLDPQSRILVRDFIKAFGKEKTIILTTHNMDEADRLAHRIAIIDYGKLLLLDTAENMKKTIGEGDILELVLAGEPPDGYQRFAGKAASLVAEIRRSGNSILIRNANIVELVASIKAIAVESGLEIEELKLRTNTLEDVFIHLTGRSLRQ